MAGTRLGSAAYWAADGRLIYSLHESLSNNATADSLWAIKVDPYTGKPNSGPQSISKGSAGAGRGEQNALAPPEILSLTVSADGKRAAFLRSNMESQVFIAEFAKSKQGLNAPYRLTLDENGNLPTAWTPDSKSVLFSSNRNGTWKIFKQPINQTTAELIVEGRVVFGPRLSADGSEVLYMEGYQPENPSIPVSIMRKTLAGGAPQQVLQQTAIGNIQCARIPSRLCLFSTQTGPTFTFFSFDPEHGNKNEVAKTTVGKGGNWSLSPDGSLLAIVRLGEHEGRIRFMSLPSGVVREVALKNWPRLSTVDWSADGAGLLMPSITPNSTPVLLYVDLQGQARVIWEGEKYAPLVWTIPSPDGRYLALNEYVGDINVWMIENF